MSLDQPARIDDEYDPLAIYGPPDPDDAREVIFREVVDTSNPYQLMSPIPPPGISGADSAAWMKRYVEWKKSVIDAAIITRANDVRARENHGILLRLKAFMGGPHGPPVPYGPPENQAYWDARVKEERARLGLPE
jgi:hypothetical protein